MADINSQAYVRTYTGRKFFPSKVEDLAVDIIDIAHALANVNRYNGHLELAFNVAQHSLIVEEILHKQIDSNPWPSKEWRREFCLMALLHDATEAYMPDMPKPIKDTLPDFRALEKRLQKHIFNYFGLPYIHAEIIHRIDQMIRKNEMFYMSNWPEGGTKEEELPYDYVIRPISSYLAEKKFLERFNSLWA